MNCYISSNIIANLDPQVEEMILQSLFSYTEKTDDTAKKISEKKEVKQAADSKYIYNQFLNKIKREKLTILRS